jgi:hypothetical protein
MIHPVFQDKIKCVDTFKMLTAGFTYIINGFGTDKREGKNVDVWYIKCLDDESPEFTVVKTTFNILFDRKIIIDAED